MNPFDELRALAERMEQDERHMFFSLTTPYRQEIERILSEFEWVDAGELLALEPHGTLTLYDPEGNEVDEGALWERITESLPAECSTFGVLLFREKGE